MLSPLVETKVKKKLDLMNKYEEKKDTRAMPPTTCCEVSLSASVAGPFRTPSRVMGSPHGAFLSSKREKNAPGLFKLKKIKAPRGVCFDGGVYFVLYGNAMKRLYFQPMKQFYIRRRMSLRTCKM